MKGLLLLAVLSPLVLGQGPPPTPSQDQCLEDGYFCFEVSHGPKYTYRIRPDDERAVFRAYAVRNGPKTGTYASHKWDVSFETDINEADATLWFNQVDQAEAGPGIKLQLSKLEEDKPSFKILELQGSSYVSLPSNRRGEFFNDLLRSDHSVSFTTTDRFDERVGLENKNMTIGFNMNIKMVKGQPSTETLDFTTPDTHVYLGDNPEIRAYRDKRQKIKQQEKKSQKKSMTIISIVGVVAGLLVMVGASFAIYKFRK